MVISHLLQSKRHKEQSYKSCVGILSLANKYTAEELNIACRKAWNYNRISYREVKAYLEDLRLQRKLNREDKQMKMFSHENLRDSAIYQ